MRPATKKHDRAFRALGEAGGAPRQARRSSDPDSNDRGQGNLKPFGMIGFDLLAGSG
jgi:hypothetical protein